MGVACSHTLKVENLKTCYRAPQKIVNAIDGISFSVATGEIFGVCGESGSGKSTLARSIMQLPPARVESGHVFFEGEDLLKIPNKKFRKEVLWKKISIIPQSSMDALNPMFRVGDQIVEKIRYHTELNEQEARLRVENLFKTVGIDASVADLHPFEISGGMNQRALIVMSLVCDPKLILADEPTSNLDVLTQDNIVKLLVDLQKRLNLTLMFITHDIPLASEICQKIAIMYVGKMVETGDAASVLNKCPLHPYTQGLIKSIIPLRRTDALVKPIGGVPANPADPPRGCRFHPRCPFVMDKCRTDEPELIEVGKDHFCACHNVA